MNSSPNFIIEFLEGMNGVRWLFVGFGLLILEVLTGTTYILWPAAAALIVGLIVFILPLSWSMQFLLFAILAGVFLWLGHKYLIPSMNRGEPPELNDRARSMVGIRVRAVADFETGRGRVQVGDTQWRASMASGNAKDGEELKVVSIKGTTLEVEPL